MSEEEVIIAIDALYKEEQTKDVRSIIRSIKSKRNLRSGYITYSTYIAEQIDRSINFTEYISHQIGETISYTEYIAENIK